MTKKRLYQSEAYLILLSIISLGVLSEYPYLDYILVTLLVFSVTEVAQKVE